MCCPRQVIYLKNHHKTFYNYIYTYINSRLDFVWVYLHASYVCGMSYDPKRKPTRFIFLLAPSLSPVISCVLRRDVVILLISNIACHVALSLARARFKRDDDLAAAAAAVVLCNQTCVDTMPVEFVRFRGHNGAQWA